MFKKIFLLLLLLSPLCAFAEQTVYDRMLEKAVKENDLAKAEEMIKKGGTLNNASSHILIQEKKPSLQMAKLFHKYKLKLARTENSSCLLGDVINYHLKEKDLDLVKYFVEIGEDLDCYYNSNRTGKVRGSLVNRLFYFQKNPSQIELKAIDYVLGSGAKRNINKYYLRDEMSIGLLYTKGHSWKLMPYSAIDLMVKHGLDLSEPYAFKSKDKNGTYDKPYYIPHVILSDQRNDKFSFDLVKRSIKSGLDINTVDTRGWTMLDYAHNAKFDDLEIYLLENGGKYANFSNLNSKEVKTPSENQYVANPYVANPNGTVYDKKTNLTWMRCSLGQSWDGKTCNGEAKEYTWHDATKLTHQFAGSTAWRLPTVEELDSLVYCSKGRKPSARPNGKYVGDTDGRCLGNIYYQGPTINITAFPNTPPTGIYWSSSPYAGYTLEAWDVIFKNGLVYNRNKNNYNYVRLVRAGQ